MTTPPANHHEAIVRLDAKDWKKVEVSHTVTTPACHLTLPLASASFRYFSHALRSPPEPFCLFSINFCFCSDFFPMLLPPTASLPLRNMFPVVQYTSDFIIKP